MFASFGVEKSPGDQSHRRHLSLLFSRSSASCHRYGAYNHGEFSHPKNRKRRGPSCRIFRGIGPRLETFTAKQRQRGLSTRACSLDTIDTRVSAVRVMQYCWLCMYVSMCVCYISRRIFDVVISHIDRLQGRSDFIGRRIDIRSLCLPVGVGTYTPAPSVDSIISTIRRSVERNPLDGVAVSLWKPRVSL